MLAKLRLAQIRVPVGEGAADPLSDGAALVTGWLSLTVLEASPVGTEELDCSVGCAVGV